MGKFRARCISFNTQPPEGGWGRRPTRRRSHRVSTHSRPKAAGHYQAVILPMYVVSTHSRPKAAGSIDIILPFIIKSFNTQPPEGGWNIKNWEIPCGQVSTHSRPKAAGMVCVMPLFRVKRFQHTAARRRLGVLQGDEFKSIAVSTHSRPKAAGQQDGCPSQQQYRFQHTAARRRLAIEEGKGNPPLRVSTHSRPKAAGFMVLSFQANNKSFNTQPPEGGWASAFSRGFSSNSFNTQPPEGGWYWHTSNYPYPHEFQHTAARRRLGTACSTYCT